jgi:ABC-type multidrug transport system fused ATPase/permease subunit
MYTKILSLFNFNEKIIIFIFIFFLSINAFLELIAISSLIPFTSILLDQDINTELGLLKYFDYKEYFNHDNILVQMGLIVLLIFFFKNIYSLTLNYLTQKFIYKKYRLLASKIFEKYLYISFENHLSLNSSVIQRNINTEVFWLVANILIPMLMIITEVIVVLVLISSILIINPYETFIIIAPLLFLFFIFSKFLNRKVKKLGKISQNYFAEMIKHVNQSLSGIKVTKVNQKEDYFLKNFDKSILIYSNNASILKIVAQWPRYFSEILIVTLIVIIPIYLTNFDSNFSEKLPFVAFYAMAGIRLMPSINRIMSSYTNIKYYSASLDVVHKELYKNYESETIKQNIKKYNFKNNILFEKVEFIYQSSKNITLKEVSFNIKKKQTTAFIGLSGSGKTTIVDLICNLLKPTKGKILIDNHDINTIGKSWQKSIGYVTQNTFLIDDTIKNNIIFGSQDKFDKILFEKAIQFSNLENYLITLKNGVETMVGENGVKISGGEKQRISIARAIYSDPDIIIFDESTSSLDDVNQSEILKYIEKMSKFKTVIIIAHKKETIQMCDQIIHVNKGNIQNIFNKNDIAKSNFNFNEILRELK